MMSETFESLRSLSMQTDDLAEKLAEHEAYGDKLHPKHDRIVYLYNRLTAISLELAREADEIIMEELCVE